MRAGETKFNKLDFFALFSHMHVKTMTPQIISHAWEKTGLISYKPHMILSKIREMREKACAKIPPPILPSLLTRTPKDHKEVIDYGQHILTTAKEMTMSNDFRLLLERHIKGSTANVYSRDLVKTQFNEVQSTQLRKRKRNALPGNVASKSGLVVVGMVRAKRQKEDADDLTKAE